MPLPIRALLFDMDGVLYNSEEPIPGAAETLAWVREQAIPHLFLTNTTSRPRRALAEKLARFGIEAAEDRIMTPPVAAAQWLLAQSVEKIALFVPAATQAEFAGLPFVPHEAETGADAIVIGDLGAAWDFATLNRAFRQLQSNPAARLIALGGTKFWQGPTGLQLDVAPFTAALACATGREPMVFGKPSRVFFETAVALLGVPAANCLMIGDDIEVDIAGAQSAGLQAALVRTGKFRGQQRTGEVAPEYLFASVSDVRYLEPHPPWR
jgi:HAD superfamily hydrolase (TIGR01458 family)